MPETGFVLTDSERLAMGALAETFDVLVADIVDARIYSGPDAHARAQSQAQREIADALVSLVRAKREEPVE